MPVKSMASVFAQSDAVTACRSVAERSLLRTGLRRDGREALLNAQRQLHHHHR